MGLQQKFRMFLIVDKIANVQSFRNESFGATT